jgi:hypothetical protein
MCDAKPVFLGQDGKSCHFPAGTMWGRVVGSDGDGMDDGRGRSVVSCLVHARRDEVRAPSALPVRLNVSTNVSIKVIIKVIINVNVNVNANSNAQG